MLFDHDWHIRNIGETKNLKVGYTFNSELIKDPKFAISEFHRRGIRVGLVLNPTGGIYPHEMYYPQASQYLGVTDQSVIPFDPLNPKHIDVLFKIEFGFSLSRNDLNKLANEYNKIKDDKNNEFVKQL